MPGTFHTDELRRFLDATKTRRDGWQLRLFINDFIPDHNSQLWMFQEASFGGYNFLDGMVWALASTTADGTVFSFEYEHTWSVVSGPYDQVVYGYYLTHRDGLYAGGERHSGPGVPMATVGASYTIRPAVSMRNVYDPSGGGRGAWAGLSLPLRHQAPEGSDA